MRVLIMVLAIGLLSGCRSFYSYYGMDNFGDWMSEMGCIRYYGTSCDKAEVRGPDADMTRTAARRAVEEAR